MLQPQPLRGRRPRDLRRRGRALHLARRRVAAALPRGPVLHRTSLLMAAPRFVEDYLGYLLGQANHALYKEFDAHVRAAGLSSIEWRVLAPRHDGDPLTEIRLAKDALITQPSLTN